MQGDVEASSMGKNKQTNKQTNKQFLKHVVITTVRVSKLKYGSVNFDFKTAGAYPVKMISVLNLECIPCSKLVYSIRTS